MLFSHAHPYLSKYSILLFWIVKYSIPSPKTVRSMKEICNGNLYLFNISISFEWFWESLSSADSPRWTTIWFSHDFCMNHLRTATEYFLETSWAHTRSVWHGQTHGTRSGIRPQNISMNWPVARSAQSLRVSSLSPRVSKGWDSEQPCDRLLASNDKMSYNFGCKVNGTKWRSVKCQSNRLYFGVDNVDLWNDKR